MLTETDYLKQRILAVKAKLPTRTWRLLMRGLYPGSYELGTQGASKLQNVINLRVTDVSVIQDLEGLLSHIKAEKAIKKTKTL